ncbi:MAG TPA: dihydroorotase [Candidatus Limnocylindria bacterium]
MTTGPFGRLTDAPARLVITGARVIDPGAGTDAVRDIAVADGTIVAAVPDGAEVIDGSGLVVAPGFCDLHAHLRQPGASGAETIESGARAAARGGFTTICAMPNTDPAIDSAEAVSAVLARALGAACRVRVIGAATVARAGGEVADVDAVVAAGAVGFSDDGAAVSASSARAVLERVASARIPLFEHAEDAALAGGGVMRAGPTATRLGLAGWPPEAEVEVVRRDLALAEETGARLHLTHISTRASVDAIGEARRRGVSVTCDVTPHHLALTDEWVGGARSFSWEEAGTADETRAYDGACRVNPPLASREDALALLAAVEDGTVDAIATDHAPHTSDRKLVAFDEAAPGLIGLETALSLGLAAVEGGLMSLGTLIAALSSRPAAIIGESRSLEVGEKADLVLFDPTAHRLLDARELASASSNTPLLGAALPGVVHLTVANGRVTYRSDGR